MTGKIIGIYSITNNINNKYYIGSSINIIKRWYTHTYMLNNNIHANKHLQSAWTKYGPESFSFDIIKTTDKSRLRQEEEEFISINHDRCYNIQATTNIGGINARKVAQYNKDGILVKVWNSLTEASKSVNLSTPSRISVCCKKYCIAKGYYWRYVNDDKVIQKIMINILPRTTLKNQSIYVFSDNGVLLDIFKTRIECKNTYNISLSVLSIIQHSDKNKYNNEYFIFSNNKNAALDEYKKLKKKENDKTLKRYEQRSILAKNNINNNKKPCKSIDKNGITIFYDSISEAAIKEGVNKSSVCSALIGKTKTCNKKTWEYYIK